MEMTILLCRQNAVMALYLMIGYFLYKKRLITERGTGEIGKLLLYIIMPSAILNSYLAEYSPEMLTGLAVSFGAAVLSLVLAVAVSRGVFGNRYPVEQFGAAFSNAGFIGIPLVQMLLGQEAVFYIASFVAVLNILQWTYGVYILTGDKSAVSVRKIAANPIVISFLLGIGLFLLPVRLPGLLTGTLSTLASMNGPLAMIVLGVYLGQLPLRELLSSPRAYGCSLVRLLLIPVLTLALLSLFPAQFGTLKMALLLAAAAPAGSNAAIFAQLYGADYTGAVKDICLSTVLCIFTLPVLAGAASWLWGI